jgi:hypothetical protein
LAISFTTESRSFCAAATVTPGASRPMPFMKCVPRGSSAGSFWSGTHTSESPSQWGCSRTTPSTVWSMPSRRMVLPTMSGRPAYCFRQKRSPSMATAGPPTLSSSSENSRPRSGGSPSTRNAPALIRWPDTRTGSPSPERVLLVLAKSARPLRLRERVIQSCASGAETEARATSGWTS